MNKKMQSNGWVLPLDLAERELDDVAGLVRGELLQQRQKVVVRRQRLLGAERQGVELGHRLLEELAVRLVSRRRRRRGGGEKRFQERVRSGGVGGRGASSSND